MWWIPEVDLRRQDMHVSRVRFFSDETHASDVKTSSAKSKSDET